MIAFDFDEIADDFGAKEQVDSDLLLRLHPATVAKAKSKAKSKEDARAKRKEEVASRLAASIEESRKLIEAREREVSLHLDAKPALVEATSPQTTEDPRTEVCRAWDPLTEERWATWPKAGPGQRPSNMGQFKKVVRDSDPGEFWGLIFPHTPEQLREMGPEWLTRAMHTTGTLPLDNAVERFVSFDVKAEDVTATHNEATDSDWGGAGLKVLLKVEYKKTCGMTEMFIKMPHAFTGKNERYKNSVTASGDWQEIMFYNLLGGRLPMRTPRCYFADMSRRTTNFILIIESIPYGRSGTFAAPAKYRDWELPCAEDFYFAHAKSMAQFFGWYKRTCSVTTQVERSFMDEATAGFRQYVFAQTSSLSLGERDQWFLRATQTEEWAPIIASSSFGPKVAEGFLDLCKDLVLTRASHVFPKELTEKAFTTRVFREATEMSKYLAEMTFYCSKDPEYFSLIHPNAQIDNAWYWREDGEVRAGILDWGGCSTGFIPTCMGNAWMGAESELMDAHEAGLVRCLCDEYERVTGVNLDVEDVHLQVKLSQAVVFYGCCANIGMLLRVVQNDVWPKVQDRFDPKVDNLFLARCYFVQIQLFLSMWQHRSPYKFYQQWMKRTGLHSKA